MALLKTAVIVMGVLIFAGIAAVGVTLVNRVGGESSTGVDQIIVAAPPGARILESRVEGKTIVLRVVYPDGKTQLRIHNSDGKLTSTVDVIEK